MTNEQINERLLSLADEGYKSFNSKIVNTRYPVIGVRTPAIKQLAKEVALDPEPYFSQPQFTAFEHPLLYGLVLGRLKLPAEELFARLDFLLPKMDSWAHVDQTVSAVKALGRYREKALEHFLPLASAPEMPRRFLVIFLMTYCLDAAFLPNLLDLYEQMQCGDYYVNMGIAWGLSVALVKFYEPTLAALQSGRYNDFVHNKALQKAIESYRVSDERKALLRTLKRKTEK